MQRHRQQEFIRFLNRIEREVPADKAIHVILDNYAAHKKDKVSAWLDRHPRWTFHFTPTSCSWLNAVEGFFAKLTRRRLKHGNLARGRLAPGVAGEPLLARFQKLFRPAVIQTLGDALAAAQDGDALLAAQARHHDPDLLLSRILLACLAPNIPNRSLRRVVLAH